MTERIAHCGHCGIPEEKCKGCGKDMDECDCSVTARLDVIATELEQAGAPLMAMAVDKVSDKIDKKCVSCEVCGVSTPFIKTETGYRCDKHWGKIDK
jgi:hypothetical protein